MLYPAVARWNSKCFGKIERRRIQFTTTNIIATAKPMKPKCSNTFPPDARLRKRHEFKNLPGNERKLHAKHFLIIISSSSRPQSRIGITVTTKVDKRAVQRNRIKRIIRELFRHFRSELSGTFDIVAIARQNACECSSEQIREEILVVLKKNRYLADNKNADNEKNGHE